MGTSVRTGTTRRVRSGKGTGHASSVTSAPSRTATLLRLLLTAAAKSADGAPAHQEKGRAKVKSRRKGHQRLRVPCRQRSHGKPLLLRRLRQGEESRSVSPTKSPLSSSSTFKKAQNSGPVMVWDPITQENIKRQLMLRQLQKRPYDGS